MEYIQLINNEIFLRKKDSGPMQSLQEKSTSAIGTEKRLHNERGVNVILL